MCKSLQTPDSRMLSEEQSENFEIFENDQRECNHYPLVFNIDTCPSVEEDKDLNLNASFENRILLSNSESDECLEYPILKMQNEIRLQDLRLHAGFRKFFINSPRIDRIHPP